MLSVSNYLQDYIDAELPERGHSLTIDEGWREVAQIALAFVRRFA